MNNLTQTQILEELERAIANSNPENPDDAYTTNDFAKMLGLSPGAIRNRLQMLSEAGRLEAVRVTKPNIAGIPQARIAYRILPMQSDRE
jgi:DNA-binding Lrp family transcriptional regulator